MARVKLSEFRAKSLLVPNYQGRPLMLDTLGNDVMSLDDGVEYAVKVDQGVKKRGKQGLLRLGVSKDGVAQAVNELSGRGFRRFVAEPMVAHDETDERYLSVERTADGLRFCYIPRGGVEVESRPESRVQSLVSNDIPLPAEFLHHITAVMDREHMSFVEINPLVVSDTTCSLLDAAVLVDSAGEPYSTWTRDDVVEPHVPTEVEVAVAELNENSTASFSFRVLNPEGALWLLLSGGGASITLADEAHNTGQAALVGNYGEYSGGPTTEETYLYAKHVLRQAFQSYAPKKAVVIAGGVANFTDVKKTFTGIIQALEESREDCRKHGVKVFVRRGGPNETGGLALMREFLEKNDLLGSVHGSDIVLSDVIHEALEYVHA